MSLQEEISIVKRQIAQLQENLRVLESCLEDDDGT